MSEKTARQVRKECNQMYSNVNKYARRWANQQIKKQNIFQRIGTGFCVIFKRRVF